MTMGARMTDLFLPDLDRAFGAADRISAPESVYRHSKEWCEENLWIKDNAGREMPLRYNFVQCELERIFQEQSALDKPIRLLCLKSRKHGVSTWMESVVYDWTKRLPTQLGLILAHDATGSSTLYEMFETYYAKDQRPRPTQYSHRKGLRYYRPHGSQVVVMTAGTRQAGTAMTPQVVHLSEVAKWPDPQTTALALLNAVPDVPGTFVLMESTAFGAGDWWNDQWNWAAAGASEWTPIFFPWFCHPETFRPVPEGDYPDLGKNERYNLVPGEELRLLELTHAHVADDPQRPVHVTMEQIAWRRWAIDNKCGGDVLLFHQEQPSSPRESFISAGHPKFNVGILSKWLDRCRDPELVCTFAVTHAMNNERPTPLEGETPDLLVWRPPVQGHRYVIGADCKGWDPQGDRHAALVWDKDERPIRHVASLVGMWDADLYASLLVQTARWYFLALLAIEVNGVGEAVQNSARRLYHHFYHRLPIDKEIRYPGDRIGWYTSLTTRPNVIERMAASIRDETFVTEDEEFVNELRRVQSIGSRGMGPATNAGEG